MTKKKWISFEDWGTSVNFPKYGEGEDFPKVSLAEHALNRGFRDASKYDEKELLEMLGRRDIESIYKALGAIRKKKLRSALNQLMYLALYDEDKGMQESAVITIRMIGGRKAFDVLKFLKTTEHKEFIEKLLKG